MSDSLSSSHVQSYLTVCPVCSEQFDDAARLPRRLSCCVQCVCQPCLQQIYNEEDKTLLCPVSHHKHELHNGVTSLPTEPITSKILDYQKIQRNERVVCTDCPSSNEAIARCEECCVFLCKECRITHDQHRLSRHHRTHTFEEIKGQPIQALRRLHECGHHPQRQEYFCNTCEKIICVSCTVEEHREGAGHMFVPVDKAHQEKSIHVDNMLNQLDEKAVELSQTEQELLHKVDNMHVSALAARQDINKCFEKMIEELQQRKATLLSDVEERTGADVKLTEEILQSTRELLAKVRSSTEYIRLMRSMADNIEDLHLMLSSTPSLNGILAEEPKKVEFVSRGTSFVPANLNNLASTIKVTGMVRSVTYTPTQRPKYVPQKTIYNTITLEPAEVPAVCDGDMVLSKVDTMVTTCIHLEWDSTVANRDVTVEGTTISNARPDVSPNDTGCRIQSQRCVMASKPLIMKTRRIDMFQVKSRFSLRQKAERNTMLFETALTPSPLASDWNQLLGLSVSVVACPNHKTKLCVWVRYGKLVTDLPLFKNEVGMSCELHWNFLLDGNTQKIHVINVRDGNTFSTVSNVLLNTPLWVLMYVSLPSTSEMTGELISGHNIDKKGHMFEL
ncbi:E3 ubiquitin-protein ligase TRIM56-like [Haliotis rufescens]|uniref:E3 ubiquitin-protein ligase TRIM56-like n=2 Tax=Haliotis rufescens TaxID=6454 RepID=UPI00201FA1DC|nr:E3 ubiquitin-protein ligase TRIM56-like [Haliotis rufescens]